MLKCSECDKEFTNHQSLNAHKIAHKNGQRYSVSRKLKEETFNCIECDTIKKRTTGHAENKFCSNNCQHQYMFKERIKKWIEDPTTGNSKAGAAVWVKRFILQKQNYKCSKCGIQDWNNKPITLELEHKDGNSSNNTEENLECLCPNCHSQTSTYKAKNKGNGRKLRYIQLENKPL